MSGLTPYPDTIFDIPASANGSSGSGTPLDQPGQTFSGGRLMSSGPHIDGLIIADAAHIGYASNTAELPSLVRNAKGDWSLNATANVANVTQYYRITLEKLLRLGETYVTGDYPPPTAKWPSPPPKGIMVLDFFALFSVGVANLTSANLRLGQSVFSSNTTAPANLVATDIVAVTNVAAGQLVTSGNANAPWYADVAVPGANQAFATTDLTQTEIELAIVAANTGTTRVYALGAHVMFNYN